MQDPRTAALEAALADALAQRDALARDNEQLAAENARLAADAARAERGLAEARRELDKLVEQIALANARMWGRRSEKAAPGQLSLFNDVEACAAEPEPPSRRRARPGRKPGSRDDWSGLEAVVVDHVLGEGGEPPSCPSCGSPMADMGYEVKRVVRMVPAHLVVEEHRVHKYVCRPCADRSEPGAIARAEGPALPLPGTAASPELLAHVVRQKYELAMPVNRVASDLRAQQGLPLTRQTLCNWVLSAWERWLSLIYGLVREKVLAGGVVHCDETTVQCLKEPGRSPSSRSYVWLYCTPPRAAEQAFCFEYRPTRSHDNPRRFLAGWSGTLMADGYQAYDGLGPGVLRVSCLAHIRRRFHDIVRCGRGPGLLARAQAPVAWEAIDRIAAMYRVDGAFEALGDAERLEARRRDLAPLVGSFGEWAAGQLGGAAPGTRLHSALSYAAAQWPKFSNVLEDGAVELDDNWGENSIRPFTVGRRNWLFSDTPRGAEASAGIYSVVTTAKANGLKPYDYLVWLFTELPGLGEPQAVPRARLEAFAPWSPSVPEACRLRGRRDWPPEDRPLVDVDPHALDGD